MDSRALIISHTTIRGGARLYINSFVDSLAVKDIQCVVLNYRVDKLLIPFYKGVQFYTTLFYIVKTILNTRRLIKLNHHIMNHEVIVFTSSVTLHLAVIYAIFYPSRRIYVMIQENLDLSNVVVKSFFCFAKRVRFYNISLSEHNRMIEKGFNSYYLPNVIDLDFDAVLPGDDKTSLTHFDVLYSGGDLSIKGFDNLLKILASYEGKSLKGTTKFVLLGNYNDESLRMIDRYNSDSVEIEVVGLVSNIEHYIVRSRLVILPIQHPHFCRVAIECGILKRTFVIHHSMRHLEFVNDSNCLLISDWANFSEYMSELQTIDIHAMEEANFEFSTHWNRQAGLALKELYLNH